MAAGGLRFHGSWSSIGWQTDKSPLDMARVTKSWEDAGFDYVPCGDTTFRECYVCLIAMALSTERVRLGTYVTNPSTRAPFVTVQTIASVDDASNDRAWLGIGLGDQRAKHFITGADGAAFYINVARTGGEAGDEGGAAMFLAPAERDGIELVRHIMTVDKSTLGGHCELRFHDVCVPGEDFLGEVDEGFRYVQVRLGPAWMTHVMRWTGAARRAHKVAVRYAAERRAFGTRLAELGLAQQLIADSETDLAATRALLNEACRVLDNGGRASRETSITKTFAAEALDRVVDRATQLCGGPGVSGDLPVAKIARELRPFRIYEAPSEVHRWSLGRRAARELAPERR